jgi:hypothetical protein
MLLNACIAAKCIVATKVTKSLSNAQNATSGVMKNV